MCKIIRNCSINVSDCFLYSYRDIYEKILIFIQKISKIFQKKFAVLKKAVSLRPQKRSSFSYKFSVFPVRMGESPRGDAAIEAGKRKFR